MRAQRDGVRLQNMVYYRSTGAFTSAPSSAEPTASATHYFVMTAEADSLLAAGAIKKMERPEEMCDRRNVDLSKLAAYARKEIAEFVPELAQADMVRRRAW